MSVINIVARQSVPNRKCSFVIEIGLCAVSCKTHCCKDLFKTAACKKVDLSWRSLRIHCTAKLKTTRNVVVTLHFICPLHCSSAKNLLSPEH